MTTPAPDPAAVTGAPGPATGRPPAAGSAPPVAGNGHGRPDPALPGSAGGAPVASTPAASTSAASTPAATTPAASTTDGVSPPAGAPGGRSGRRRRVVGEWVLVLVAAVLLALGVRHFVLQTFYIPSASMEPTLQVGDRILVDKLSYRLHGVGRGDIVVFRRPPAETADLVPDLVKRVVGLPGETVSGVGGHVDVNGHPLAEPWLPRGTRTEPFAPIVVPAGDYFMMGDNRADSYDSRDWGPLPRSYIVGRVDLRIWPVTRLHSF